MVVSPVATFSFDFVRDLPFDFFIRSKRMDRGDFLFPVVPDEVFGVKFLVDGVVVVVVVVDVVVVVVEVNISTVLTVSLTLSVSVFCLKSEIVENGSLCEALPLFKAVEVNILAGSEEQVHQGR